MIRVVLNNYYAKDYMGFCHVVERDEDMSEHDVKELITAIQFLFEERVDESLNPTLESIGDVLSAYYGFRHCDKRGIRPDIQSVLDMQEEYGDSVFPLELHGIPYIYMDLYSDREHFCGPGQPEKLWNRWIPKEIQPFVLKQLVADL